MGKVRKWGDRGFKGLLWSKSVKTRDRWTCQRKSCRSKTRTRLVAHHVLNYRNNLLERFNIQNGITLCILCQRKLETILRLDGYRNEKTLTQEFLVS